VYQTAIINNPFSELPDTLYIEERIFEIPEVTVSADRFTREQKMKVFREQFLGITRAGSSCVIQNEDDIQLYVNNQTRRLVASSDKPIKVVNNYLGYEVSFILVDFWVEYDGSVINLDRNIVRSLFAVTSSFTDLASDDRRIKQRRDNTHELSTNHFFKSFTNNTLNVNNFRLFNKSRPIDHLQYFTITHTPSQTIISVKPDTDINKELLFYSGSELSGIMSLLYRRGIQSDIYFMTDSFSVDRYGNIDAVENITFSGRMGESRAGDMLPLDYE
jgi:hypothetical protein